MTIHFGINSCSSLHFLQESSSSLFLKNLVCPQSSHPFSIFKIDLFSMLHSGHPLKSTRHPCILQNIKTTHSSKDITKRTISSIFEHNSLI